jgi:FkbM family methyltransferase
MKLDTFTAGSRSGVWTVCPDLLNQDSLVYAVGVGDNVSWDVALLERFHLTVHAFDPTPASIAWVASQSLPPGFFFHPVGLAGRDGTLRVAGPRRGNKFNCRPLPSSEPDPTGFRVPVGRLATLMRRLGHERIDVLKMDIEGGEYEVLDDLLAGPIRVPQLLVEFHHHFPGVGIARTERAVRALKEAGYRIFHISERGLEISFLHALTVSRAA